MRPRPALHHRFRREFSHVPPHQWPAILVACDRVHVEELVDHGLELRGQEIRTDRGELLMVGPECSGD